MLRWGVLVGAVVVFSNAVQAVAEALKPGDVVTLECLGESAVKDPKRYLHGLTKHGRVNLTPQLDERLTATKWKLADLRDGAFGFECLGKQGGVRWLNGGTADGGVGLVDKPGGIHTGARWRSPFSSVTTECSPGRGPPTRPRRSLCSSSRRARSRSTTRSTAGK